MMVIMMTLPDNSGVLEAANHNKISNSNEMDVDASVSTAVVKVLPKVWKMGWVECEAIFSISIRMVSGIAKLR